MQYTQHQTPDVIYAAYIAPKYGLRKRIYMFAHN